MESIFIWIITLTVAFLIFLPFFLKARRQQKADKTAYDESRRLGADKPLSQHPKIDPYICIGCGACVRACPEGDVLGIVSGKATIINGMKCVGHGLCAEACPVEGITIGLGDLKKRTDLPLLSETNETSVPGIYLAGEVTGIALIRNAIEQGKMVMKAIEKKLDRSIKNDSYDVVIVGAGPAGISAALYAKEKGLSYCMIDQYDIGGTILQYPRKKLVMTQPVELPLYGTLDKSDYRKEQLLEIWEHIYKEYGMNVNTHTRLTGVIRENGNFRLETSKADYRAKNVVLALGRRGTPRKLGVKGEDKAKVMYKLIDTIMYQNEKILIVGGGDSAIEAAHGLALQKGNTVTLSYRKDRFFRIKQKNQMRITDLSKNDKIKILFNSTVKEIKDTHVHLDDSGREEVIENDYIFIFAGGEPPYKLLHESGIRFGG